MFLSICVIFFFSAKNRQNVSKAKTKEKAKAKAKPFSMSW